MRCKPDTDPIIKMQESELAACEWKTFKEMREIEFYSIANQVVSKLILPNVDDDGKWKNQDNDLDVIDNLRYSTLNGSEALIWNRPQKFYTLFKGVEHEQFK